MVSYTVKDFWLRFDGVLAREEKVTPVGFGTFQVMERKARRGRNPRTGDTDTGEESPQVQTRESIEREGEINRIGQNHDFMLIGKKKDTQRGLKREVFLGYSRIRSWIYHQLRNLYQPP